MSVLSLRFREQAMGLNILYKPELDSSFWDKMTSVIKEELSDAWKQAVNNRLDTSDPETLWDILGIDAVLSLEDATGQNNHVGVSLQDQEHKAYKMLTQGKNPKYGRIRRFLNIERYWVFLLDDKKSPTPEEWIDLLYSEIDLASTEREDCKLIVF